MFCPRCSQQQVSEEPRFCSRCGFQLHVVKSLLASGGALEEASGGAGGASPIDRSRRRRDWTVGAAMMFGAAFLVAALTVELPPGHSGPIFFLFVAWLALTLLINLKSIFRFFVGHDVAPARGTAATKGAPAFSGGQSPLTSNGAPALPPARDFPATDFAARGAETAEARQPPSVAEPTTSLLRERP